MNEARFLIRYPNKRESSIRMEFWFYGNRAVLGTGVTVYTKHWNPRKMRVKSSNNYPDFAYINRELDNLNERAKNLLRWYQDQGIRPTKNQFQAKFKEKVTSNHQNEAITFESYLSNRIADIKAAKGTKASVDHIGRIRTRVGVFHGNDNLLFEDIDEPFIVAFKAHLYSCNYDQRYVKDLMKRLKSVLKQSYKEGIHKNISYESSEFKVERREGDFVRLSLDELNSLYNHDFSESPRLDNVRDCFIIQCDTGLRYSDLSQLDLNSIVTLEDKPFFRVITQKTGREVYIPLSNRVQNVIDKYGDLPKVISNQKMNEYLSEVCRLAGLNSMEMIRTYKGGIQEMTMIPKWQLVKTHTARRSFATNAMLQGSNKQLVMLLTGHSTEKSFDGYVQIDRIAAALELADSPLFNQ